MSKIVKVGDKAHQFVCTISGVHVIKGQVIEITDQQSNSPRVKKAISNGHLVVTTKDELEDYEKELVKLKKAQASAKASKDSKGDNKALIAENATLVEENATLTGRVEELEEEVAELKSQIEILEGDDSETEEAKIAALGSKNDAVEYLKANYSVDEAYITEFSGKKLKEMKEDLLELSNEDE